MTSRSEADFVTPGLRDGTTELNGEPIPPPFRRPKWQPTCPRCGRRADPDAAYCKCGKNLYRQEVGH